MPPTQNTGGRRWEGLPKGSLALLLMALACAPPDPAPRDRSSAPRAEAVTEFVNAYWLVGDTFAYGSRSVAGGRFVPTTSAPPASRIDMRGAWVVPAFGDAHTHNLDGDTSTIAAYRREGVAYVQVLTNTPGGRERVAPALEGRATLDAVYANGGITSTYGHPMLAYEPVTLVELEDRLDGARFVRVHRSHIVNLAEVREVRREDERRLRVVLSDGSEVVASRSGSTRLRERF